MIRTVSEFQSVCKRERENWEQAIIYPFSSTSTFEHLHRVIQDMSTLSRELPVMWEKQTQTDECGYLSIQSTLFEHLLSTRSGAGVQDDQAGRPCPYRGLSLSEQTDLKAAITMSIVRARSRAAWGRDGLWQVGVLLSCWERVFSRILQ